jgi:hypothetical protein
MMAFMQEELRRRGSPGAHLGVSLVNHPAQAFYRKLGFTPLAQVGEGEAGCLYLGIRLGGATGVPAAASPAPIP